MVDDQIFREVDEELRQERLKTFWNKYGLYVIAGLIALIALIGGFKFWQSYQTSQREVAGDQFVQALKLKSTGKNEQATQLLETLSKDSSSGYQTLATIHLAAAKVDAGDKAAAETLYKKVANDPSADKILSDYAKLNLALLRLDGASFEETKSSLSAFTSGQATWKSTALEVVALAALKEGKLDEARKLFSSIKDEPKAPSALKRRAQIMLDVVAARKAAQ